MKYGYDIICNDHLVFDSGDLMFNTKEEAIKDAEESFDDAIEDERCSGRIITKEDLEIYVWEGNEYGEL